MAHIKAGESRDGEHRRYWKMQLIRMLYQRGLSREDILELFRLLSFFWRYTRFRKSTRRRDFFT